jgi:hypothetical protein
VSTVVANDLTGRAGTALIVGADTPMSSPALIRTASRSSAPATTLKRNLLVRNAAHGIEAIAGVTDGGRNVARANGADPQCIGVVCH